MSRKTNRKQHLTLSQFFKRAPWYLSHYRLHHPIPQKPHTFVCGQPMRFPRLGTRQLPITRIYPENISSTQAYVQAFAKANAHALDQCLVLDFDYACQERIAA